MSTSNSSLREKRERPATKQLRVNLPDGTQMLDTDDIVVAVAVSPEARSELRRRLTMPLADLDEVLY